MITKANRCIRRDYEVTERLNEKIPRSDSRKKKGKKDYDIAQKYAPAFLQDASDLHCKLLLWRAGVEGCLQVKKDVTQRLCFRSVSSLCANFFQTWLCLQDISIPCGSVLILHKFQSVGISVSVSPSGLLERSKTSTGSVQHQVQHLNVTHFCDL